MGGFAGDEGVEARKVGVRVECLTAWRVPIMSNKDLLIIPKSKINVKYFLFFCKFFSRFPKMAKKNDIQKISYTRRKYFSCSNQKYI